MGDEPEIELTGGNVSEAVVRVGGPRALGRDDRGRTERWVFIDRDGALGSRLWTWRPRRTASSRWPLTVIPPADAPRLRALADGYGLDEQQRGTLPELIVEHTCGMHEVPRRGSLTGEQPWARLWNEGHGEYWGAASSRLNSTSRSGAAPPSATRRWYVLV